MLDEIPIDVFQELVLIAYKQRYIELREMASTFVIAIGTAFSKKGKRAFDDLNKAVDRLDSELFNLAQGADDDTSGSEDADSAAPSLPAWERAPAPAREHARPAPTSAARPQGRKRDVMQMARNFHRSFARLVGSPVMSLDAAINKAVAMQKSYLDNVQAGKVS